MNDVEREMEMLRYNEVMSDFGSIVIQHGAAKVARDFYATYPAQCYEFYRAVENKDRPVAALLKAK